MSAGAGDGEGKGPKKKRKREDEEEDPEKLRKKEDLKRKKEAQKDIAASQPQIKISFWSFVRVREIASKLLGAASELNHVPHMEVGWLMRASSLAAVNDERAEGLAPLGLGDRE